MGPGNGPVNENGKRASPSVITPRLAETSAKRRRRTRQPAAAPAATSPPPAPPLWRHGWEEVDENEYTPAARLLIAERQRRRQRTPGAAAATAAASRGSGATKERRLRVHAAALDQFSEAEQRGLPHCMSKFRNKGADARRTYCGALLAVREITDHSHPAKQSGLQQGRAHEWGLFARRPLVRGTLLGELTGLVCTGEEADAAAAADPRGLGGLRADKIKSLAMTAAREGHGGGASKGSSALGWSQELVIDGAAKSCMLRFVNCHEGIRPEPNIACVEAEDIVAGSVHVFMVTIAPVAEGEELLLDYGPHFLRHIREEAQRAAALCTLERQVADLQAGNAELVQQTTRQKAHGQLQEQAYLDLLEEYRAQQQQRQQQQEAAEAMAAERVAALEAKAAENVAAAEAQASKLNRRLKALDAALSAARAEAAAAVQRESASLAQFCEVARQREALLGAQAQAALTQLRAQLDAKDAEIAAQQAAAEEARSALAAGQQQWEAERGQLAELLQLAQQQHVELHRLLAAGSLSTAAVAALDAATAAFDAAAAAAAGEEGGMDADLQQQAFERAEGTIDEYTVTEAAAPAAGAAAALAAAAGAAAPAKRVGMELLSSAAGTSCRASFAAPAATGKEGGTPEAAVGPAVISAAANEQQQQQQAQQPAWEACSSAAAEAAPSCEGPVLTAAAVAAALAAQEAAVEQPTEIDLAQEALGLLGGYGGSSGGSSSDEGEAGNGGKSSWRMQWCSGSGGQATQHAP